MLSSDDGSFLVYRTMLKAIRRLYKRAGVVVPKSETGRTRPFHSLSLRHRSAASALAGASRS